MLQRQTSGLGEPMSYVSIECPQEGTRSRTGVRRTTPEGVTNCELNIFPCWSTSILRMVRFWNNIAAMRPDTLHYRVLLQDLRLAIVEGKKTFAGTLVQQLKKLGYYIAGPCAE